MKSFHKYIYMDQVFTKKAQMDKFTKEKFKGMNSVLNLRLRDIFVSAGISGNLMVSNIQQIIFLYANLFLYKGVYKIPNSPNFSSV